MKKKQVLAIDDEPLILEMLGRALGGDNYDVFTAPGGQEALAYIRSGVKIDIVITDLIMPGGVNGIDVVKECRKLHIPVLVLSGSTDYYGFSSVLNGLGYDPDSVLCKPVNINTLLNSVEMNLFLSKP